MEKHKILSDIGIKDEDMMVNLCGDKDSRNKRWAEERKIYGFDERETWSLDTSFAQWLLERLIRYKEISNVDLTYHKFDVNGETLTQEQCMDRMINLCKRFILTDMWDDEYDRLWYELTELWKICGLVMWW